MTDSLNLWRIYSPEIPEFLQEASQVPAMQRLKQVGMNCGCEYTSFPQFSGISPYSRFDHSMGAALILWHFTGKTAVSLAGLFHDIATPAFAHVVDFLYGDYMTQEATEAGTSEKIRSDAQIRKLLKDYHLKTEEVEDYHIYPIADNDSPKLSADRLEYTLGNSINYKILSHAEVERVYHDLSVGSNENGEPELVFDSPACALMFSEAALKCSRIYVSDPDRYAMQFLAELLQKAIENGYLKESDLQHTEPEIIQKLTASPLQEEWKRYLQLHKIYQAFDPGSTGKWRKISAKKRHIDPYIASMGRASSLFPSFRKDMENFRNTSQNVWLYAE